MEEVIKQLVEIIASGGVSAVVASIILGFVITIGYFKLKFERIMDRFKDIQEQINSNNKLLQLIKNKNIELSAGQAETVFELAVNKCFRKLLKNYYDLEEYVKDKEVEELYEKIRIRVVDECEGLLSDLKADLSTFTFKEKTLDDYLLEDEWANDWNHMVNEIFIRVYEKTNSVKEYLKNKESRVISEFKIKVK